jgi:hypothetical protein
MGWNAGDCDTRQCTRVKLATGHTDMCRGFPSLVRLVQENSPRDPHAGDLYVFRSRRLQPLPPTGSFATIDTPGICLLNERWRCRRFDAARIDLHCAAGTLDKWLGYLHM